MPIRLVIADDHPLVLDGLERLFSLEPDFEVISRCRDGEETLAAVQAHRPEILVLDIRMPKLDGLSVLREMRAQGLATHVVILTAALDDAQVVEAMKLDVRGLVLKEMAPRLLIQCIRKVHAGGQWIEREAGAAALAELIRREAVAQETAALLSPREIEVVRLVARGLRNKEIAQRLSITEGTVKVHLHNIYEKLHVDGRTALALHARNKGLV
jgi:DNA-binding NarL/FixJ family response regulator